MLSEIWCNGEVRVHGRQNCQGWVACTFEQTGFKDYAAFRMHAGKLKAWFYYVVVDTGSTGTFRKVFNKATG